MWERVVCGEGRFKHSGCGKPFYREEDVFRCVDCGVSFHRVCAKEHFERDSGPTKEQEIAALKAREKLHIKAVQIADAQCKELLGALRDAHRDGHRDCFCMTCEIRRSLLRRMEGEQG